MVLNITLTGTWGLITGWVGIGRVVRGVLIEEALYGA